MVEITESELEKRIADGYRLGYDDGIAEERARCASRIRFQSEIHTGGRSFYEHLAEIIERGV